MISHGRVKSFLVFQNLTPYDIGISLSMIQSVKSAGLKYEIYIEEQGEKKEKFCESLQLPILNNEIAVIDNRRKVLRETSKLSNKKFEDCSKKVGEQTDPIKMRLILNKGNDLLTEA